ncbi:MAG TPA: phosphoribosylanthranilate isomerase [Bacteroidia bacterium]|nr:phosphoribosylanthranilate isomerase [Bacteroidia bacterium]
MKYKENVEQVAELKPDYMGFIFYAHSKRNVSNELQLLDLPAEIEKVGVFVNADADFIIDKISTHNLNCIQLHGNEPPFFCRQMKRITSIIKAFGVDEHFDFNTLKDYEDCCDYFLFDTKTPEHGGSGRQFNWDLLDNYSAALPFFISGGLDLEAAGKTKELAKKYPRLYAIDVNSKFEKSPGLKDVDQLRQLMHLIRN